jgi:hypothetical protein
MTLLAETPTTTGPTLRSTARSARGPVLVVLALVLTGIAVAAYSATGPKGTLDPAAYNPDGSHALAALLRNRDVAVRRVESVQAVENRADSTVFVPIAAAFTPDELGRLADLPGRVVVVGAAGPSLVALGAAVTDAPVVSVERRAPACALPLAVRAGDVHIGGITYRATGAAEVTECYASSGRPTLVDLPVARLTLLGSADLFTNARLDERGNAALAMGLLGSGRDVQWLLPRPGARDVASDRSLNDLISPSLKLGALELLVALLVLALWRARALGPVVSEPLPVVVRAAEAVEGRSRLYRAARARGSAADALRTGARDRLARRLGLGPDATRAAVVDAVVARIGRDPVGVDALLYGAAPNDDAALVRIADDLDILIREVAGS